MTAATVHAVEALVAAHPQLAPVLAQQVSDNDGMLLPHLVLADIMRWLVDHRKSDPAVCAAVMEWLERAYENGPENVRGLITVSGVAMIPDPGQPGADLRSLLGPRLALLDPWR